MADGLKDNFKIPQRKLAAAPVHTSNLEVAFFALVACIIAVICIVSIGIAIEGLVEKNRLMRGLQQIEHIVFTTRQMAPTYRQITNGQQQDLLAILNGLGQIKQVNEVNGVQALMNPWGDILTAKTMPDAKIRIETTVPSAVCRRIMSMFGQLETDTKTFAIEVRSEKSPWIQVYSKESQTTLSEAAARANCGYGNSMSVALIFQIP